MLIRYQWLRIRYFLVGRVPPMAFLLYGIAGVERFHVTDPSLQGGMCDHHGVDIQACSAAGLSRALLTGTQWRACSAFRLHIEPGREGVYTGPGSPRFGLLVMFRI
jgi:hypothetical protein